MSSSCIQARRITGSNVWKSSSLLWLFIGSSFFVSSSFAFAPNGGVASVQKDSASSSSFHRMSSSFVQHQQSFTSIRPSTTRRSVASSSDDDELVVIPSDYRLGVEFLLIGLLLDYVHFFVLGLPITLLGILFAVQASRIQFVFTKDSFELRSSGGNDDDDDDVKEVGENIIVGGENSWKYDSFVNWEFFPKGWIDQPQGPILAYFKETQTPSDKWDTGPGKFANKVDNDSDEVVVVPGQVHFFPAICNAQMLRAEFQKRGCTKLN